MLVAVSLVKTHPRDPRLHHKKPQPRKRQTRTDIRTRSSAPPEVASLDYNAERALFNFLSSPARHDLPMLSRWGATTRDWCHTPDEIELIAAEVERALAQVEPSTEAGRMLNQLLALAHRAVAEDLLMLVCRDG